MVELLSPDLTLDPLKSEEMKENLIETTTELSKLSLANLKNEVLSKHHIDIHQKPIHLGYKEINKEKKIALHLPDQFSAQGRILRCLRWKSATDAVEDTYGIPRGLLLAMMAQEGMGDPTMPNLSGDGGLGLIHIQAVNAAKFGLKTLPRYTEGVRDLKHGKIIVKTLNACNYDVKKLIKYDDRFHPIMGLDCSARFLKNIYTTTPEGKDRWINALRRYSGRALNDYLWPVVKYWVLINKYTGDPLPDFSKNTNKEISTMKKNGSVLLDGRIVPLDIVKTSASKLAITIDGIPVSYPAYLHYTQDQLQNYGLDNYKHKINTASSGGKKNESITTIHAKNLEYLRKSKDGQWNIYKFTFSSPKIFELMQIYTAFHGKPIQFTDAKGKLILNPAYYPHKKGDILYIKDKILK